MEEREFIRMESDNLFADLGLEDADELLLKSQLINKIDDIKHERRLTQATLGKLIEMPQGEVSRMLNGDLDRFTLDRLVRALNALDVRIRMTFEDGVRAS